jgi:TRAP-type C4-dicarboxylate transport system permease small subunit
MSRNDSTGRASRFFGLVAGYVLAVTMGLVVVNVVLRPFGHPIKGSFELVGYFTSVVIGLALADCAAKGGHIRVSFVVEKLPVRAQAAVDLVTGILASAFLVLAVFELCRYAAELMRSGEVGFTTQIPYYPYVLLVALGFLLYALVSWVDVIRSGRKVVGR